MKWEYDIQIIYVVDRQTYVLKFGDRSEGISYPAFWLYEALNIFGKDGWEVVTCVCIRRKTFFGSDTFL